jgi:serine/threonine-protein phosphatase CPPED1
MRYIIKSLFCLFLYLLVLPESIGQKNDFFFVQLSDPQFGFFTDNKDFTSETALFEKAVAEINRISPAFVVITGDLVNDQSDKSQWDEFRRIVKKINVSVPVWIIPGNHDLGKNVSAEDIEGYKEHYGYDRFSFNYGNCVFIGINSSVIKAGETSTEQEQFKWLGDELAKAKGARKIIVFSHHPLFINNPDEQGSYSNLEPVIRQKYLNLLVLNHVNAVFAGHLHNNASGRYHSLEMVTTSAVGRPLGNAPSGFRIIEISGDSIRHKYYDLNKIPEVIVESK